MAAIGLEVARQRLEEYLAAEAAVLAGQSVSIGDRQLRMADLSEVRRGIEYWSGQVARLEAEVCGVRRARAVAPGW